jgi:CPA2 family monovalent cation:H+ antiporter-2
MHIEGLLFNLTVCLTMALFCGMVAVRLHFSPIAGYLIAGIICGPFTPGIIANETIATQMADIGLILLMFGVGLHFDLKDLWRIRRIAIPGALIQSLVTVLVVASLAHFIGMTWLQGCVLGLALSVASTAVLARMLEEHHLLTAPEGRLAMGWLVVEDLFTVITLLTLPFLAVHTQNAPDGDPVQLAKSIGLEIIKITILFIIVNIAGSRVVPKLLESVSSARELFNIAIPAVALSIAMIASGFFGVSLALGAFLAGIVSSQSVKLEKIKESVLPIQDLFVALFFLSIGTLVNLEFVITHPMRLIFSLLFILALKPMVALILLVIFRQPLRLALVVAIGLSQVGEFSFILIQQAHQLKLIPASAGHQLIAAAMISIIINPILFRNLDAIESWFGRFTAQKSTPLSE